jgi:hypothetical protein
MGDGGEVEVRDALEGQLQGRTFVRDNELEAGAIHIDEFVEERDDGLGRIIKIPHRRPEVVDIQPTSAVPARPAFKRVAELISSWLVDHPGGSTPPIIVHLSRGSLEIADIREAVQELESCRTLGLEPLVYHLVETEFAHRTVKYPANPSELTDRRLSELWELSSPLLAREELAKDRPQLTSGSRGFVVNANLDLLLHPIREAIGED